MGCCSITTGLCDLGFLSLHTWETWVGHNILTALVPVAGFSDRKRAGDHRRDATYDLPVVFRFNSKENNVSREISSQLKTTHKVDQN
jgi:hypothetical protein